MTLSIVRGGHTLWRFPLSPWHERLTDVKESKDKLTYSP